MTTHRIQSGETLSQIARQFHTTVDALAKANGISDPNKIAAGADLQIPGSTDGFDPPAPTSFGPKPKPPQPSPQEPKAAHKPVHKAPAQPAKPATSVVRGGLSQPVDPKVEQAIRDASKATGVDYGYLKAVAAQESGFDPNIGAKPNGVPVNAAGLYQFTDQSWLGMVHNHGKEHGMGELADHIHWVPGEQGKPGSWAVDPEYKDRAFAARLDPQHNAMMGAEFTKDNVTYLKKSLGRGPTPTELYTAAFLGPGGAAKFIKARAQDGSQPADKLFPAAAAANKSIFYKKDGTPRSLDEINTILDRVPSKAPAYDKAGAAAAA
jgi:LysM repeat protein